MVLRLPTQFSHKSSKKDPSFTFGLLGATVLSLLCMPALAEVKSLSSSELTETYIKDSTLIITPKQLEQSKQSTITSITIAPVEELAIDQDLVEIQQYENHQDRIAISRELDDETLRNASVELAVNPLPTFDIASFQELNTIPVADILQDERYRVPEGDFEFDYVGNDLGLSRTGDQLTFSIGNLPGIDTINLPEGIDEGPVTLIPREGGGFDLTITVPEALRDQ